MNSTHHSRRWALVLATLAGTALLAGCAGTAAPSASPTPELPSMTPSPTPSAPPVAGVPDALFDGNCSLLFSAQEVSVATDSAVALVPPGQNASGDSGWSPTPFDSAITQLGGVACTYRDATGGDSNSQFAVVAADRVTLPADVRTSCDQQNGGAGVVVSCSFGVVASGISLTGVVSTAVGAPETVTRAAVDTLVASFTSRAAAMTIPEPYVPSGSPWQPVVDCGMLVDAADLSGVLGVPGVVGSPGYTLGGLNALGRTAAATAAGYSTCIAESSNRAVGVTISILPGGGWVAQSFADLGAERVAVDGLDSAFLSQLGPAGVAINGFAGDNWINLELSDPSADPAAYYPALTALVSTLG